MKRIGIVLPSGTLGGAEQLLVQIAKSYLNRGNEVVIFSLTNKNFRTIEDIFEHYDAVSLCVCPVRRELLGVIVLPFLFLRVSLFKKLDIIFTSHAHLNSFTALCRKMGLLRTTKHVGRESTVIFRRYRGPKLFLYKIYYYTGYRYIDLLICQTDSMKSNLIANLPWMEKAIKLIMLQNPINLKETVVKRSARPSYERFIVAAGRLIPEKGFDLLIEAFKLIKARHPYLKLIILGDGPEKERLSHIVDKHCLSADVSLLGWKNNVYDFFAHAEICVVSSRVEGFPNVLLQMMANNERVVSTLCAGGIEQIDGLFTCIPNDINQLSVVIESALNSPDYETRRIFDNFLQENDIESYVMRIEASLDKKE